ncbi:MAG: hypothetical protein H7X86_06240 [Gorillibacterium sp.]|nr:hypothetical protein [Gorillibacterium sp.]
MKPNALLAFLLSFCPGLGHLYLNRKLRAFLYAISFFGLLFIMALNFDNVEGEFVLVLLFAAFIVWGINLLDVILYLNSPNRHRQSMQTVSTDPSDGASEDHINQQNDRFNTILLSIIPGLGHFHLGLMQRGLTFLVSFFGFFTLVTFVTFTTRVEGFFIFLLALPVIWLYCMFDAVQLVNRRERGEQLEDRSLFEDLERSREEGKKSRTIATVLAIFPGAGHMYLGLQRRGLQLMAAFLFSIYIMDTLHLSLFLFLIPLIWFYSLFDALQNISKYDREPLQDTPIVNWLMNHQKWVGFALLGLGCYFLFERVGRVILEQYFPNNQVYLWLHNNFSTMVISFLLIFGGIRLLIGDKSKNGGKRT